MIKYITHNEIDFARWDVCIEQSILPLVYAKSWYLNTICPGWDALVLNDYDAVMPLTKGKKYFINYLYQPFFTQQLGIFSKQELSAEEQFEFIKSIPQKFKFIDINLNQSCKLLAENYHLSKRKNYELQLNKSYDKLIKNYSGQTKRNLKKAASQSLSVINNSYTETVNFYKKHKGTLTKGVKPWHYQMLLKLLETADVSKHIISLGAVNNKEELLASAVFISYHGRLIFVLGTANNKGRDCGAMYAIFDYLIHQHAATGLILDFEGSEIPGIARFFKNFGAEKTYYYKLKINRLPLIFKLFKR
ncbi:MAG: hypothetical protein ACK4K9_10390 [Bacteroidia bacterium]